MDKLSKFFHPHELCDGCVAYETELQRAEFLVNQARSIMENLTSEYPKDGWMRIWHGRWKISDEPLRNDAKGWLKMFDDTRTER